MKKTISIIAILAAALAAVSCDSYFNVNLADQATLESLYSKRVSVRNFVSNMYTYLPREEHVDASEGMGVLRADESLFGASQYTSIAYKLRWGDYGSATVDGDGNGTFWNRYYQAINQCTIFLQNIDRDQDDAPEYVTYMKAEATVMRAYYYYCLFRHYGPVIIWGEEQASMDTDGSTLDRNTLEENVGFMLGQIEKALPDLPLRIEEVPTLSDEKDRGRVTKGFALALKMRILLLQASPLFNGNKLYASMTNREGKKIFPESQDLSKWDLVAKAAQDVLDLRVYELVQPKGNTMQDYADAYQSVFFENWNSEVIWGWWFRTWAPNDPYLGTVGGLLAAAVPMQIASTAGLTTKAPLYGWQLFTPSLKLVDAFPMMASGRYPVTGYDRDSKGLNYSKPHVDPVSGYVAEGWENNYTQPVDVPWAAPFKAHKSTVGRDPRFYSNFVPNGFWWPDQSLKCRVTDFSREQGKSYTAAEMKDPEVYATNQWLPAGNINRVGYTWRRWYKANTPLNLTADYSVIRYVYPSIRLAEVYYNLAEALNEKPARDGAGACAALNKVRNRVGLPNIEVSYPGIEGDQELLRWCIRQDKMCEYAFEGGMRHSDEVRNMYAKEDYPCDNWTLHLKATNYEDSWQRVNTDYNGENPAVFTDRDYLFPMSSSLMAEMVNYTQNYGF